MRLNFGTALTDDVWEVREGRRNFERSLALAEARPDRLEPPELWALLGRNNYLRRELVVAAQQEKTAFDRLGRPPEFGNNVGVTLSTYAAITGNPALLTDAIRVFQLVTAVAPGHGSAEGGFEFTRQTLAVWNRYFTTEKRDDGLVRAYALGIDMMAASLASEPDPRRRLQALQILDGGLARLPSPKEMENFRRGTRCGSGWSRGCVACTAICRRISANGGSVFRTGPGSSFCRPT